MSVTRPSDRREAIPSEVLADIKERKAEAVAEHIAALSREVSELRELVRTQTNMLANLQLPYVRDAVEAVPKLKRVTIGADWALRDADGFYVTEYTDTGIPFRWTGPMPTFVFALAVDRSQTLSGRLRLMRTGGLADQTAQSLSLSTNEGTVPLTVGHTDESVELTFTLPPQEVNSAVTLLRFYQVVWSPSAVSENGDRRQLGVPFLSLDLQVSDVAA